MRKKIRMGALHAAMQDRQVPGATINRGALVALLIGATTANLLQLNLVPTGGRFRPVPHFQTADITQIAEKKSPGLKARYALFFEIGRKYPGSTIVLPQSDQRARAGRLEMSFLSYGRAARVARAEYSSDAVLSNFEYESFIVAKGSFADKGKGHKGLVSFAIAAGSDPNVFLFLRQRDKVVLVDLALLLEARAKPHD